MRSNYINTVALGIAFGVSLFTQVGQASTLPITNSEFTSYTGSAPKGYFSAVAPTGWTLGSSNYTNLVFVDAPGTEANGSYLSVYGPFPNSPAAGNIVEADGNPNYEGVISQTLTGLTVGQTYTLGFYQAAGQQTGFTGATTEQWIVSLGKSALSVHSSGSNTDTYKNTDNGASIAATTLMNTPSKGDTPWEYVTVNLTADATTDVLSFLAWGDGGSTVNEPPIVFLSGLNSPTPEPASLSILGAGLLGCGLILRRRRSSKR